MFITFEGIDGSGKSTQIGLLKDKLQAQGLKVSVFREPGGTVVSEEIRRMLLETNYKIDPITELLLFSAARSQLISEKVRPLLEHNSIVILDRFFDSTVAYQGYGRGSLPLDQILELNAVASHRTVPDLTFYLQIHLHEAKKRTAAERKDRMEQSGDEFYQKVIEGFEAIAAQESRFITLDATLPPDELHQQVWDRVELRLP